jgi:tRNA U34 5-carboxymethylaminomethyl modifying enzyme MnmG/GidA
MNSNTVLGKIMTLLSLEKKEEKLTVARLADGTLVESPTFDVGEKVEIIHEDGTKTPAPDGEHLLELRDESDNINRIKIFTEGGIIKERENVEIEAKEEDKKEEEMADVSTEDVKALPESGKSDTEVNEQVTLESEPGVDVNEEVVDKDADEIVNLTTKLAEQEEKIEEMKERIEELVKYFEEIKKEEEKLEEEAKEEKELESKKLDGAPVEKSSMFNKTKNNNFKVGNYRNSVLSKMYK